MPNKQIKDKHHETESLEDSILSILVSSVMGGMTALLVDVFQKGPASSLLTFTRSLSHVLNANVPAIVVGLLIVSIAGGLSFVFSVDTKLKAFYTGLSIFSILSSAVPYSQPTALPGYQPIPESQGELESPPLSPSPDYEKINGGVERGEATNSLLNIFVATAYAVEYAVITVTLKVADPNSFHGATISLLDKSGKLLAESSTKTATFKFSYPTGHYILRVEASGFSIVEKEVEIKGTCQVQVDLLESNLPTPVQSLWKR